MRRPQVPQPPDHGRESAMFARASRMRCALPPLYAPLIRLLMRWDREGALPPEPLTEIIAVNRWVAQHSGVLAFFGDATREDRRVDIEDIVTDLVEELVSDDRALGCEAETRRALAIIRDGTSTDRKVDLFRLLRLEGDTEEAALHRVFDLLLAETWEDIGEASG